MDTIILNQEILLKTLAILVFAFLINWTVKNALNKGLHVAVSKSHKSQNQKFVKDRAQTLSNVLAGSLTVVIYVIALFMILQSWGIDISPLLTGFGVLGIAVGLGAQTLVRDLIGGFFIIYDNQFLKGDIIEVNGKMGEVTDLSLRRVVIRDLDGIAHIIPNSEIKTVSNYTKGWAKVKIDIDINTKENTQAVFAAMQKAANQIKKDTSFEKYIFDEIVVEGITQLKGSAMTVRMSGKVVAEKQWVIGNELRSLVKEIFQKEKIDLA